MNKPIPSSSPRDTARNALRQQAFPLRLKNHANPLSLQPKTNFSPTLSRFFSLTVVVAFKILSPLSVRVLLWLSAARVFT